MPRGAPSGRTVAARTDALGLYGTARFLILLRVLLLAVGLGVLTFGIEVESGTELSRSLLGWLLLISAAVSAVVAALVRWFDRTWKLVLPLGLDVIWVGCFCYASGGVQSPAVPLLFMVSLTALLVVPGFLPFVIPSLTSLVLAGSAMTYLAGLAPYPPAYLAAHEILVDPLPILGNLIVQVAGLYTVDALGQVLTRRLREQRILTDVVLDQLGEGVLVLNQSRLVAYVNQEAERLLGLDDQAFGRPVAEVLDRGELAAVRALMDREDLPVIVRHSTPTGRSLVLRLNRLSDRRGRVAGRILLVADETRLVVLEESARRAERLASLGEMAAGIAHEIRNPLTGLRGCAQEVADIVGRQGDQDAVDLSRIIISEADRLSRIVDDVLEHSRLRSGERSVCRAEALFDDLRPLLRYDGVEVEFSVEDGCAGFNADVDQMRQVLLNLIANAVDAVKGRPKPRVHVHACDDDADLLGAPAVRIEVRDNGCGIPPAQLERIFTPFYTTKAKGTGLGLSLVQRMIRENEGVLRIESEVDQGTVAIIALPSHTQTRTYRRALGAG